MRNVYHFLKIEYRVVGLKHLNLQQIKPLSPLEHALGVVEQYIQ